MYRVWVSWLVELECFEFLYEAKNYRSTFVGWTYGRMDSWIYGHTDLWSDRLMRLLGLWHNWCGHSIASWLNRGPKLLCYSFYRNYSPHRPSSLGHHFLLVPLFPCLLRKCLRVIWTHSSSVSRSGMKAMRFIGWMLCQSFFSHSLRHSSSISGARPHVHDGVHFKTWHSSVSCVHKCWVACRGCT